ncbi:hypothetical protein PFISCL1PPCAC_8307, partial [Pristionchus fissidentatus]
EIARDFVISYYCGLLTSFTIERCAATRWWKWYEKASPSTLWILIIAEAVNIVPAAAIASLWMLGYIDVGVNVGINFLLNNFSCLVYYFTYKRNQRALTRINKGEISFNTYSVARTFQLRENVMIMRYFVSIMVPSAVVAVPSFLLLGFHDFGPPEWFQLRKIGYALFDLNLIIFRAVFLYLEITSNNRIRREFCNIKVVSMVIR